TLRARPPRHGSGTYHFAPKSAIQLFENAALSVRYAMSSVLVVNEISTEREEVARALEAEGFTVVQASSAAEATREIWGGSFLVAISPTLLTGTTTQALEQLLTQMAPEIETLVHGKNDELPALVRKCIQIRDGEAAA